MKRRSNELPPPRNCRLCRAEQDGIDAARHLEIALEPPQRYEHRSHRALLRSQRELAELVARQDASTVSRIVRRCRPCGPSSESTRNLGRLLQPRQQVVAARHTQLVGERRRCKRTVARIQAVKSQEPVVDTIDEDTRRAPARRLVRDDAVADRSGAAVAPHRGARQRPPGSSRKRSGGRYHDVGAAEPSEREIAQAAADRIADEQRAGEDRDRRRDAKATARFVRQW